MKPNNMMSLYAIGTYLEVNTGSELVGHVPLELSYLIYTFLRAYNDNEISVKVTGSRRLENGLAVSFVVPASSRGSGE